ncbi:MAG: glycosyltransferase family 4 protein [Oscillospiraceae bacterium]
MKVNIEVQSICGNNIRGIPFYTLNLLNSCVARKINRYSVSFFDFNHERNNIDYIKKYIPEDILSDISVMECNNISYKDFLNNCEHNIFDLPSDKSYNDWFDFCADVYHFPHSVGLPASVGKNSVVTIHDILPVIKNDTGFFDKSFINIFHNTQRYIHSREDILVIADSCCTKADLINYFGFKEERIFVTPLGCDFKIHYHEESPKILEILGIHSPYILYVGAIDPRKGLVDIIRSFNIVKDKGNNKDLKLVFSGNYKKDSPLLNDFNSELLSSKYKNDIIITGYVTDEQKRALLSSAEVFLFPSEYEGFGLPVLEAMACGAPVITTNISSLPEVGGDAVLYVSPNQPEELAEQICKFIDSQSLRDEYISKGYERTKQFSWDKTAALTEEVYKIAYDRTH